MSSILQGFADMHGMDQQQVRPCTHARMHACTHIHKNYITCELRCICSHSIACACKQTNKPVWTHAQAETYKHCLQPLLEVLIREVTGWCCSVLEQIFRKDPKNKTTSPTMVVYANEATFHEHFKTTNCYSIAHVQCSVPV